MDLKKLTAASMTTREEIHKIREHFNKNDDSIYVKPEFMTWPFQKRIKQFGDNYIKIYQEIEKQYPDKHHELIFDMSHVAILGGLYMTLQAFLPPIQLLGTEEQLQKWRQLAMGGRLFGAYAQTEIGHGSDVQSLQTIATYNKESKTFILHTPSTKAIKFWPGALGCQSTHCVCQAQTYVDGKYCGLQTFVVPLRDPETYKLYEGVDSGDIGPKLAYSWNDNGYLKFTNYHIPLDHLLMKFIKVDEAGNVTKSGDKTSVKIGYGGMLGLRVALSNYFLIDGFRGLAMAYRNTSKLGPILPMKKREFLSDFAFLYSNLLTVDWLMKMFKIYTETVTKDIKAALRQLDELHNLACGIKAYYSSKVVEIFRRHSQAQTVGNLMSCGVVVCYGDTVPSVTYEGDNAVMLQQLAKTLCKYMRFVEMEEFQKIPESFRFLEELRHLLEQQEGIKVPIESSKELLNVQKLDELIGAISIFAIKDCYEKMKERMMSGESMNAMWNEKLQGNMIAMAMTVTRGIAFKMTRRILQAKDSREKMKVKDFSILEDLLLINGLDILRKDLNAACLFKIGAVPEKLEKLIDEAQEAVFSKIEESTEYVAEGHPYFESELYFIRDYNERALRDNGVDRIRESLGNSSILPKL